eukprot:6620712-Prymnesium_polylepis.1
MSTNLIELRRRLMLCDWDQRDMGGVRKQKACKGSEVGVDAIRNRGSRCSQWRRGWRVQESVLHGLVKSGSRHLIEKTLDLRETLHGSPYISHCILDRHSLLPPSGLCTLIGL